jgi:hypothetical protein
MNPRLEVLRSRGFGLNRNRTGEEVERAGCGTDLAGSNAEISGRRQAPVAEQQATSTELLLIGCPGISPSNSQSFGRIAFQ